MIDAHCHLQADGFGDRLGEIISEAADRGVKRFVVNGTSEKDWPEVAEIARNWPGLVLPFFGVHPWYLKERTGRWETELVRYLEEFPEAGVGEIGLDRWIEGFDVDDQKRVFETQWELAREKNRGATVHCLKAWGILKESLDRLPAMALSPSFLFRIG